MVILTNIMTKKQLFIFLKRCLLDLGFLEAVGTSCLECKQGAVTQSSFLIYFDPIDPMAFSQHAQQQSRFDLLVDLLVPQGGVKIKIRAI